METKKENKFKKLIESDINTPISYIIQSLSLSILKTPLERFQIINQTKNNLKNYGIIYKSDAHIFSGKINRNEKRKQILLI